MGIWHGGDVYRLPWLQRQEVKRQKAFKKGDRSEVLHYERKIANRYPQHKLIKLVKGGPIIVPPIQPRVIMLQQAMVVSHVSPVYSYTLVQPMVAVAPQPQFAQPAPPVALNTQTAQTSATSPEGTFETPGMTDGQDTPGVIEGQ